MNNTSSALHHIKRYARGYIFLGQIGSHLADKARELCEEDGASIHCVVQAHMKAL